MKKFFSILILSFIVLTSFAQTKAKYVFYFIGDGMGVNQVCGTTTYLAALEGKIGFKPLLFTTFPYCGMVVTNSATEGVTDSAAAGTALATGEKTKKGMLGVLKDGETPLKSIAQMAHEQGKAVGVATNVGVDHATPAAFYAHVPDRGMYNRIGHQLIEAGFDFYAGSDFLEAKNKKDSTEADLYTLSRNAGYTIAKGYGDYKKLAKKADRIILFQSDKANKADHWSLPFAIDRTKNDLSLADITRAGINFLTKKEKGDGFFLMVEGGKIDFACHANDTKTTFTEVVDMDEAIRVAYEFYQQHPDETLIVVTADHETGGLSLGSGAYKLNLGSLARQKMSTAAYSAHIKYMRETYGRNLTWNVMNADLSENWGFGGDLLLNDHQTKRLQRAYEGLMSGMAEGVETLYQKDDAVCDAARRTLNENALVSWTVTSHTNGLVPVFAVGAGSELFTGMMDNTEIPQRIAKVAGYK